MTASIRLSAGLEALKSSKKPLRFWKHWGEYFTHATEGLKQFVGNDKKEAEVNTVLV